MYNSNTTREAWCYECEFVLHFIYVLLYFKYIIGSAELTGKTGSNPICYRTSPSHPTAPHPPHPDKKGITHLNGFSTSGRWIPWTMVYPPPALAPDRHWLLLIRLYSATWPISLKTYLNYLCPSNSMGKLFSHFINRAPLKLIPHSITRFRFSQKKKDSPYISYKRYHKMMDKNSVSKSENKRVYTVMACVGRRINVTLDNWKESV